MAIPLPPPWVKQSFLALNFQSGLRDLQSDNRKEVAQSKLPVVKATRTLHGTDLGHLGWEHEVAFD